MSRLPL
ncbi:15dc1139-1dea-4a12-b791-d99d03bce9b7 [Thermothielavioides terrestris]|nr:15dc1139-1dea-4a12-b791-d99d03bce9b7 [Thermothielavioides terrestris]